MIKNTRKKRESKYEFKSVDCIKLSENIVMIIIKIIIIEVYLHK